MSHPTRPEVRVIRTLTLNAAAALVDAAVAAAGDQSLSISVAVHDTGGNLLNFARMDGAAALTIEIAQNKSYTAIAFGLPTHQWYDVIKDDEALKIGIVHTPRLVTYGGGYPVELDGQAVGAIGVSGGHYSQDMDVAKKALRACGFGS